MLLCEEWALCVWEEGSRSSGQKRLQPARCARHNSAQPVQASKPASEQARDPESSDDTGAWLVGSGWCGWGARLRAGVDGAVRPCGPVALWHCGPCVGATRTGWLGPAFARHRAACLPGCLPLCRRRSTIQSVCSFLGCHLRGLLKEKRVNVREAVLTLALASFSLSRIQGGEGPGQGKGPGSFQFVPLIVSFLGGGCGYCTSSKRTAVAMRVCPAGRCGGRAGPHFPFSSKTEGGRGRGRGEGVGRGRPGRGFGLVGFRVWAFPSIAFVLFSHFVSCPAETMNDKIEIRSRCRDVSGASRELGH